MSIELKGAIVSLPSGEKIVIDIEIPVIVMGQGGVPLPPPPNPTPIPEPVPSPIPAEPGNWDYDWDINGGVNFGPPTAFEFGTGLGKAIRFKVDQALFPKGIFIGMKQQGAGQPTYEISISDIPHDFSGIVAQGNDEATISCGFAPGLGIQVVLESNKYKFLNVRAVSRTASGQYLYR